MKIVFIGTLLLKHEGRERKSKCLREKSSSRVGKNKETLRQAIEIHVQRKTLA